jgi:hypothetical protein
MLKHRETSLSWDAEGLGNADGSIYHDTSPLL